MSLTKEEAIELQKLEAAEAKKMLYAAQYRAKKGGAILRLECTHCRIIGECGEMLYDPTYGIVHETCSSITPNLRTVRIQRKKKRRG